MRDIDRYGRTVGILFVSGENLNAEMVRSGLAWWYQRYARGDRLLQQLEEQARSAKLKLWADEDAVPPWQWRRRK